MRWESYKELKKKLAERGVKVFDRDLVGVVSCVLNQIEEDVFNHGECLLPGFGRFALKTHRSHKGWDMHAKKPVMINESLRFHFKQAQRLRDKAREAGDWGGAVPFEVEGEQVSDETFFEIEETK